jgi:aspartyl-tRNA(Asn)/glutamyl-tRNA(Gln) amidotransferase subunit C
MKITKEQVEHVAKLARLAITAEETERYSQQLSNILTYIEKLNELDTSKVEPTFHVLPMKNIFREDEVRPSLPREEILKNAPDRTEEFFRVPKIIE